MLKLFRLHVPELRFWKIKKYEKIETVVLEKAGKQHAGSIWKKYYLLAYFDYRSM